MDARRVREAPRQIAVDFAQYPLGDGPVPVNGVNDRLLLVRVSLARLDGRESNVHFAVRLSGQMDLLL
eukprot:1834280-Lingulodinium_polyedra.AAC.1